MNHHEHYPNTTANPANEQGILGKALDRTANYLKEKRTRISAAAAGVALTVALAGCGVNASAEAPKDDDKSTSSPAPEQSATPEVTETPETPTESFDIPAGLDADSLGKLIVEERLTDWLNAGASDELKAKKRELNLPWDQVIPIVVDENAKKYSVIFGPENQNDVEDLKVANGNVLNWYISTAWNGDENPQNKEGYRSWMTVNSTEELQDTNPNDNQRTIVVQYSNHTNSDMNSGPAPEREGGQFTFTLTNDGETEDITSMMIQ